MKPQDLSKRRKILAELRARLTAGSEVVRARPVLKKPQAFLMEVGEVFVYPTTGGGCINSSGEAGASTTPPAKRIANGRAKSYKSGLPLCLSKRACAGSFKLSSGARCCQRMAAFVPAPAAPSNSVPR
jgi:hypothetical protein